MEVEVDAVGVVYEASVVGILEIEDGAFYPPEVPDVLPGVAPAGNLREEVEGDGVGEHQGEQEVAGEHQEVGGRSARRSRGLRLLLRVRGGFREWVCGGSGH